MDKHMLSYRKQREAEAKAYEENIAEHKHEWKYDSPSYDYQRIMCDCGKVLDWNEKVLRLNLLEGLVDALIDLRESSGLA